MKYWNKWPPTHRILAEVYGEKKQRKPRGMPGKNAPVYDDGPGAAELIAAGIMKVNKKPTNG